jgi:hypothetical protein
LGWLARMVERVEPDHWSEHFDFVRAGGVVVEIDAASLRFAAHGFERKRTERGK